jgi:hypothetical protein
MTDTPGSPSDRKPNPHVVTPKTFEQMTEIEIEEVMAKRRRKQDPPEWGRNQFGDPRPLSAWDRIDD